MPPTMRAVRTSSSKPSTVVHWCVVLVAMLWVSAAIEARLLAGASDNLSVRKIAANAVRALLLLVGLLLALSAAGIPLGALSVMGIKLDLPGWRIDEIGQQVRQHAERITALLAGAPVDLPLPRAGDAR